MITFFKEVIELDIRERVKKLRKSLNLTQTEFGQKIGVSVGVIANLELDRAKINPIMVQHICDVFGVSRKWLETGDGEMFLDLGEDAQFELLCTEIAESEDDFIKRVMKAYWRLPEDKKVLVRQFIDEIADITQK